MAVLWLSFVLVIAGLTLGAVRHLADPQRTSRRLSVPTVLVERACADAIAELRAGGQVFTSPFEPACEELLRVRHAEVAALGFEAATSHERLVRALAHWNDVAGQPQGTEAVLPPLLVARDAAHRLLSAIPPDEVKRAVAAANKKILWSVVGASRPQGSWIQ